ncbi:MAG: coat protein [Cressdnaviricota sp.]|nr:MAG: coat protein [Cressdnaviricota sp.]
MPITKITTYKKGTKSNVDKRQTRAIRTLKKKVKALEAPVELKYLYTLIQQPNIGGVSAIARTLNLVKPWNSSSTTANNTRLSQREGATIAMRRYMLKGKLKIPFPPAGASVDREMATRVRFIYVYYPDEPPGSNINDILETSTGNDYVDYFYKRNGRLKYRVLKDVTFSLEPNYWNYSDPATAAQQFSGMASTKPAFVSIRHSLDLTKLPDEGRARWKDALEVPALGQVCLFMMSDNPDFNVDFTGTGQLTFHDSA